VPALSTTIKSDSFQVNFENGELLGKFGNQPRCGASVHWHASGVMARTTTIHPRFFVALKRRRDGLQADAVEWIMHERLPHLVQN
jgi:hypothetical protein